MTNDGRRLGRGLSALLGEPLRADVPTPAAPAPASPSSVPGVVAQFPSPGAYAPPTTPRPSGEGGPREIALEKIIPNPNQPRRRFEESELEDLAQSIRAHGVLQPILVRPIAGQATFEIVAGERRWRAAQRAGLKAIPALVREVEGAALLEIQIIENVQRADLNPIEEAQGYQSLMERFGRTQQELADIVGKSRPHIANTLRLLNLPAEIQLMVTEGRLSAGHARAVLNAPDAVSLAKLAIEGGLSVREVEKLAARAKEGAGEPKPEKPAKDQDLAAIEQMLSKALGLAVSIAAKGEGGEIRIGYARAEDLDAFCRRVSAT